MAGALRGDRGGILGLLNLPRESWAALEADLLRAGFVLADVPARVSWRAVAAFVRYAPGGTAAATAVDERAAWGTVEHLLAQMADSLAWLVWSKTESGSRNRNRPKPLRRPGDLTGNALQDAKIVGLVDQTGFDGDLDGRVIGGTPQSIESIRDWLGW